MNNTKLAERLIESIDWGSLHAFEGTGEPVQGGLKDLLRAKGPEESQEAYWRIENYAVVQGELYEVAEACTSVLIASFVECRAGYIRIAALDLLFQILSGHASSAPTTSHNIVRRCHQAAREGLWLLVQEAISGESDAALDVLGLLGEAERAKVLKLGCG